MPGIESRPWTASSSITQVAPQDFDVATSDEIRPVASVRYSSQQPKPKASFTNLQSLDSLITYREEKAEWKRASSFYQYGLESQGSQSRAPTIRSKSETVDPDEKESHQEQPKNRFRTFAAEVGFCFTIAMTQFLAGTFLKELHLTSPTHHLHRIHDIRFRH
jgi:hypothetical protein